MQPAAPAWLCQTCCTPVVQTPIFAKFQSRSVGTGSAMAWLAVNQFLTASNLRKVRLAASARHARRTCQGWHWADTSWQSQSSSGFGARFVSEGSAQTKLLPCSLMHLSHPQNAKTKTACIWSQPPSLPQARHASGATRSAAHFHALFSSRLEFLKTWASFEPLQNFCHFSTRRLPKLRRRWLCCQFLGLRMPRIEELPQSKLLQMLLLHGRCC